MFCFFRRDRLRENSKTAPFHFYNLYFTIYIYLFITLFKFPPPPPLLPPSSYIYISLLPDPLLFTVSTSAPTHALPSMLFYLVSFLQNITYLVAASCAKRTPPRRRPPPTNPTKKRGNKGESLSVGAHVRRVLVKDVGGNVDLSHLAACLAKAAKLV